MQSFLQVIFISPNIKRKVIGEAMRSILNEAYLYGYVFKKGYHDGKQLIENKLEEVADFICSNGVNGDVTLTTTLDEFVLDTFGFYINQCPDKEYLEQLKKVLIPKQMKIDGTLDIEDEPYVLEEME